MRIVGLGGGGAHGRDEPRAAVGLRSLSKMIAAATYLALVEVTGSQGQPNL